MIQERFRVPQMRSIQASRQISETLQAIPGVQGVRVNLADSSVRILHDEQVSISMLIQAINRMGYTEVAVLA
jgi:copper chaperone CopZ